MVTGCASKLRGVRRNNSHFANYEKGKLFLIETSRFLSFFSLIIRANLFTRNFNREKDFFFFDQTCSQLRSNVKIYTNG